MSDWLSQALIFFGSSVVLVPIFQRLGLGSVLGYLIAGVLVGPHAFKLIAEAESISNLSELGIIFLLFLIGLEIQPRKLWSMRRHLVGLGGMQIVLCTAVFFAAALAAGLPAPAAAVIGFALSLSSTAFATQTLTERNLFNTEPGRASFSMLLAQDLAAIPGLALIPVLLSNKVARTTPAWQSALIGIATIAVLILAGRYLFRPVFRIIASTRSRDMFTAVTLFIVIGVTVLMRAAGLSVELGTFIAGVLLADSEYRHELEVNLEPFRALLMGLFFIGVGMGVKLELIVSFPWATLGLSVLYLVTKTGIIYGVGRAFRMASQPSKVAAMTISQGGEFAFVIFGILSFDGVVPNTTLDLLTVIITVSMALNPFLMKTDEAIVRRWSKRRGVAVDEFDEIRGETPRVIIGGFGRFGQVFGRIMRAQGIPFVAIDQDPTQIELLRKFGNKVYYGDVSRVDLLESAGAARAEVLVLAIDDVEASLEAVTRVREHFPHLKIYARARNRGHVYDLMELGVTRIKRETIDSSVNFTGQLLIELGFEPRVAARLIERFSQHDQLMMEEQFKVRTDDHSLISLSKRGAQQLAQVLTEESSHSRIGSPNVER